MQAERLEHTICIHVLFSCSAESFEEGLHCSEQILPAEKKNRAGGAKPPVFSSSEVGMDQDLLIPFLVGYSHPFIPAILM